MRHRWILLALFAAATLAPAAASAEEVHLTGDFIAFGVLAPECTSFLCTRGTLTGDIEGNYFFTMTSLLPDTSDPGVFNYAGNSSITTATGTMFGQDTGVMYIREGNPAPFVTIVNVVSGTGDWAGTTGTIVATGSFDFVANTATGTYDATLTLP